MLRSGASYLGSMFTIAASLYACGGGSGDAPPPVVNLPVGSCPEIFASGLRNPWRWSFDRLTGELWLGDVGQGSLEEIDRVTLGGNYGWVCFEGTRATGLACGAEPNLQPPVAEYGRSVGTTVTGGYVYRGTAIAGLAGRYVFGDFTSGRIWHIPGDTQPTAQVTAGFDTGLNISSFGEDNDGELYIVHYGGALYRLTGSAAALGVQPVFSSLGFTQPVAMLQAPGDSSRWFVVEQAGFVRVFDNVPGASSFSTFIDVTNRVTSGGEMGLLGMAFHPGFPANPRVYLSYTNETSGRVSRISEFTLAAGGNLDPASERILLVIDQPATETNHKGGNIAFGPDGFLYIGMGDGGGGNDRHGAIGNGQLMTTLLGKMLRIDVSPASGYGIPPTNPFSANALCGAAGP